MTTIDGHCLPRESDYSFDKRICFAFRNEDENVTSMIVIDVVISFVDDEEIAIMDRVFHARSNDRKRVEDKKSNEEHNTEHEYEETEKIIGFSCEWTESFGSFHILGNDR